MDARVLGPHGAGRDRHGRRGPQPAAPALRPVGHRLLRGSVRRSPRVPASSVSYSATRTVSVVPLIPPLHNVERGTGGEATTIDSAFPPSRYCAHAERFGHLHAGKVGTVAAGRQPLRAPRRGAPGDPVTRPPPPDPRGTSHRGAGVLRRRPSPGAGLAGPRHVRSEEHTSELQSRLHLVCRLLL